LFKFSSYNKLRYAQIEKSGYRFGARKIRVKLMADGHTISERRIHRLMKEVNLSIKSTYKYPMQHWAESTNTTQIN